MIHQLIQLSVSSLCSDRYDACSTDSHLGMLPTPVKFMKSVDRSDAQPNIDCPRSTFDARVGLPMDIVSKHTGRLGLNLVQGATHDFPALLRGLLDASCLARNNQIPSRLLYGTHRWLMCITRCRTVRASFLPVDDNKLGGELMLRSGCWTVHPPELV